MRTYTTRKVGNDIVIDVPDDMGIEADKEYFIIKEENGGFMLIPKESQMFKEEYKKDINLRVEPEHEEDR